MDTAGDYLTVLQLGVGLNLVAGAYASTRKDFEQRVAEEIDEYREMMAAMVRGQPDSPLDGGLGEKKALTDRELDRYLHDVSNRFDRRSFNYGQYDGWIEFVLTVIGLGCAACLIAATMWPDLAVTKPRGFGLSFLAIAPPLAAFLKTFLELKTHNVFYRRRQNDSRAEKESGRNEERNRSKPKAGEIHRAINQVRRRVRASTMGHVGGHEA